MIYKVLSVRDTNIWIKNINTVISLFDLLIEKDEDRRILAENEYNERYLTGWRKFFYSDDYYISVISGKIYSLGGYISLKIKPYSNQELVNMYFCQTYTSCYKRKIENTREQWVKYADKPFQIDKDDLEFYQNMKVKFKEALDVAKSLGIDYEAFNLDEDRICSS